MATLWVGSRKGLFRYDETTSGWQVAGPPAFLAAPVTVLLDDPRDSPHIVLGVSVGGVWITRDGGQTWDLGGRGFEADYMPPGQSADLVMQDPHLMVMSPTNPDRIWCQHQCGIYVSDDGGWSFRESNGVAPSSLGFGVAVHPADANRAWFVPAQKDETSIPVNGKFVVTETRDGGHRFTIHDKGLPQGPAWDLVYRHALAVDSARQQLAIGSTSGNLWVSGDGGASGRISARICRLSRRWPLPPEA